MTTSTPATDPVTETPACGCGFYDEALHAEIVSVVPFTPVCSGTCTLAHCCEPCAENHVDKEDAFWAAQGAVTYDDYLRILADNAYPSA